MNQIFQPGDLAAERFEIQRLIAEGGMGQVYEARDRTLGGLVALKLLKYPNIDNEAVNRRFRREIQLARQVTHPNVCRLYDVYQHRISSGLRSNLDATLVTMELLSGETLEEALSSREYMSEGESLPLIRQMADALDAAHGADVIHRDFKPSNVILVDRESSVQEPGQPRAVVTDFGLARSMGQDPTSATPLTGEMKIVGTADYMAPEQLRGLKVGPAADIYAFGVVIFEMVTGGRPYSAPNALMLLTRRATEPPSSPLDHRPDLDPRWTEIIMRCLDEDPNKRPQSAGEVVRLLTSDNTTSGSTASGNTIHGAARHPLSKESRPRSRPGSWSLAVAAALMAAALVVILALRQEPREATYGESAQLTTAAGLELDPAFSPDGLQITYSSNQSGTFEIYVRDLGPGGLERKLTEGRGHSFEPAFSPDGLSIVYHSATLGGLWEIPAAGGSPKRLTDDGSRPAFSPDGARLAFQSESAPLVSDNVLPALGNTTLWILDRKTGSSRQLTRSGDPPGGHGSPAWAPDGERIAFSATQRQSSALWSVDKDGKKPVLLAKKPSPAYDPVFAPGGRQLYFSGATRQGHALWSLPLSRSGTPEGPPRQILDLGLASIRLSAFSPDGAKMAYTTLWTRSNLFSLALGEAGETRGEARSVTQGMSRNTRPAFSPDGTRVAWERWARGGTQDIWIMDAEGDHQQQLTITRANDGLPSWHDNGRRISFLRRDPDTFRIYSIDPEAGQSEVLAVLPKDAGWARLSPDGSQVAFHSKAGDVTFHVRLLDIASGQEREIHRGTDLTGFPCWSPDGQGLVVQTRRDGHHQIMWIPNQDAAEGTPEGILLTDQESHHYPYGFSPDSRKIAFVADRGGSWNLWWLDRETGEERKLTDLNLMGGYVRYPAWSPLGDQILFEQVESSGDIWLAESETP